jgi:hypothetical protein
MMLCGQISIELTVADVVVAPLLAAPPLAGYREA